MDELYSAELKLRVEADDPAALFEYAVILSETDKAESDKYMKLSAQLGHLPALEKAGEIYLAEGDTANAAHCFKTCAKAGMYDCAVKLAVIKIENDETAAVRELEELAVSGIESACAALAEYYAKNHNKREAAYWRSVLK